MERKVSFLYAVTWPPWGTEQVEPAQLVRPAAAWLECYSGSAWVDSTIFEPIISNYLPSCFMSWFQSQKYVLLYKFIIKLNKLVNKVCLPHYSSQNCHFFYSSPLAEPEPSLHSDGKKPLSSCIPSGHHRRSEGHWVQEIWKWVKTSRKKMLCFKGYFMNVKCSFNLASLKGVSFYC